MKSLVMLSLLSEQSMNQVAQLQSIQMNNTTLFSMALGRVFSSRLPLPSSEVTDVRSYYRTSLHLDVLDYANRINSFIPLDIEKIRYYTECFYYTRYTCAFPDPVALFSLKPETALADLFGISWNFTPDEIKVMVDNCADFGTLINGANRLLNDVLASESNDINASLKG